MIDYCADLQCVLHLSTTDPEQRAVELAKESSVNDGEIASA